jgi:hypothetical protein
MLASSSTSTTGCRPALSRWRCGVIPRRAIVLLLLSATGCVYGFSGGGLPPHVRTVAILPFDNRTGEPALAQEVSDAITQAVQGRLGLRAASESNADAIVRGEIVRYEPDIPLSYEAGQGQVQVTRRRVQITLNVEIFDQRQGKAIWQRSGLTVDGEYQPPGEVAGRRLALQKLVNDVVEGAQSQW